MENYKTLKLSTIEVLKNAKSTLVDSDRKLKQINKELKNIGDFINANS